VSERNQDNPPLPPLEERIKGFLEYLTLLVLLRQDGGNRQSHDESHGNLIRVMTVHASKGLEFPIVYLPELVQQRFPFRVMPNSIVVPKGMLPEACTEENAHETSEACLFYVGITRAQNHLILTSSDRYGKKASKRSPYLDALEAHLPAERISRLRWDHTTLSTLSPDIQLLSHYTSLANSDQASAHFPSQPSENFINAMKPSTISSSAIKAYQHCPRQYAYNSIYHFSGDPNPYYLFIQAIRKTLREAHKRCQGNDTSESDYRYMPTQQEIQALFTHYWQELDGHTTPFTSFYERHGHQIVEALWRTLLAHDKVNWDLSLPLQVEIAGTLVDVTIDRVETAHQANTSARFVHTRFGKSKEKPTAETRELLYVLAYRQQHPGQSVELHSHNVSTNERTPIKLTQKKEQSLYEHAEQAIKGLQQHEYPAQPSQPLRCPSCPFFWICPAGENGREADTFTHKR
jgi:DNA helicase II / ATP-dependent DNA helicase PcrA